MKNINNNKIYNKEFVTNLFHLIQTIKIVKTEIDCNKETMSIYDFDIISNPKIYNKEINSTNTETTIKKQIFGKLMIELKKRLISLKKELTEEQITNMYANILCFLGI